MFTHYVIVINTYIPWLHFVSTCVYQYNYWKYVVGHKFLFKRITILFLSERWACFFVQLSNILQLRNEVICIPQQVSAMLGNKEHPSFHRRLLYCSAGTTVFKLVPTLFICLVQDYCIVCSEMWFTATFLQTFSSDISKNNNEDHNTQCFFSIPQVRTPLLWRSCMCPNH